MVWHETRLWATRVMTETHATFTDMVYDAVRCIPCGSCATYGQIASAVGKPKAARAVGTALRKNPFTADSGCAPDKIVPCHRVVGNDRKLKGFFGDTSESGIKRKREVLEDEGVAVEAERVQVTHMWRPTEAKVDAQLTSASDA